MSLFQPKGSATVEKINIMRGKGESSPVSIDIDFSLEGMDASNVAACIEADDAASVENAFHRPLSVDADRNQRFFGLGTISCKKTFEARHQIAIQGFRKVRVAKISAVEFVARPGCKFDGSFRVRIEQPSDGFIEKLAEHLHGPRRIELEQDPEMDLPPGPPEGESEPSADAKKAATKAAKAAIKKAAAKPKVEKPKRVRKPRAKKTPTA